MYNMDPERSIVQKCFNVPFYVLIKYIICIGHVLDIINNGKCHNDITKDCVEVEGWLMR